MAKNDLRNLPPEEKIKKLKELEKERKKEIEDAQKEIKKSEEELTERRKWVEKVPIPEVAQEDLAGLGEDGKALVRTHRFKSKEKESDEEEEDKKEKVSLEETVALEKAELPPEAVDVAYDIKREGVTPYAALTERPLPEIQKDLAEIYETGKERGYITGEEAKTVQYALQEVERREEAYAFTESTAKRSSLIKSIGESTRELYKP